MRGACDMVGEEREKDEKGEGGLEEEGEEEGVMVLEKLDLAFLVSVVTVLRPLSKSPFTSKAIMTAKDTAVAKTNVVVKVRSREGKTRKGAANMRTMRGGGRERKDERREAMVFLWFVVLLDLDMKGLEDLNEADKRGTTD